MNFEQANLVVWSLLLFAIVVMAVAGYVMPRGKARNPRRRLQLLLVEIALACIAVSNIVSAANALRWIAIGDVPLSYVEFAFSFGAGLSLIGAILVLPT